MAKNVSEFYTGEKKKKNLAIIPVVIIVFVITLIVVLFYSTQKYAIITENGVKVELPILGGTEVISSETGDEDGLTEEAPESADATINFLEPDYSAVAAKSGANVKSVRGIYVGYGDINIEKVEEYANRLSTGNALMLEVKSPEGYMQWYSSSAVAKTYGLNMNTVESTDTLKKIVSMCKDRKIYMVAKISVCRDEIFATHAQNVILRDQYGAALFDETGSFVDPYNEILRQYTTDIIKELWEMGFDEVVMDNVIHPVIENTDEDSAIVVTYTRKMSTTPSAVGAVCGFAYDIEKRLEDRGENDKFLSIYVNGPTSLARADKNTGQDAEFFLKIYDRVYYNTDMYAYTFNVQDIIPKVTIGNYKDRFVPVVVNYLPDNTSWILVDYDEDKK